MDFFTLDSPKLEDFREHIGQGNSLALDELWEGPQALLLAQAWHVSQKHIVVLTAKASHENRLFDDLLFFTGKTPLEFPAWESLPCEETAPSCDVVGQRYRILEQITQAQEPQIILTSLSALLQKIMPPQTLERMHVHLKVGEEYLFEELIEQLEKMGYHRTSVAADKGQFAVRGGIVDLFPTNASKPYRVEFFDCEIVSLRTYDPVAQTSVEKVKEIFILPAEEMELLGSMQKLATLFDYLGPNTIFVFDDLAQIEDKYVSIKKMTRVNTKSFLSFETLMDQTQELQKLYMTPSRLDELSQVRPAPTGGITFSIFNQEIQAKRWHHPFLTIATAYCPPTTPVDEFSPQELFSVLEQEPPEKLFIVCQHTSEEKNLPPQAKTLQGYLSSGFYLKEFTLLSMAELSGRFRLRRTKQRSHFQSTPPEVLALTPGEAVVHMNSGIGRYLGMEKRKNHLGIDTEYMLLEYAEGSKLYVPMEQANMVSKYIGVGEAKPELHTIGSSKWKRTRERTQTAIMGYAEDLLKLQAQRLHTGGFACPPNGELLQQFSEEFPYIETPDQMATIEHVHREMQSEQPMDLLVCGDVGYGKTEVAMRAAFKAVADGNRQVAVLVPTTVLAMQHYETFVARMGNFGITVGQASRFCKPKELKQTLADAASGTLDILIGTHRIVGKDVDFKNLGLVIIDEEQRFGVRTKEQLKKYKNNVDCLTLSATPIPRTLYMSLVGARELSVINTPPDDRLPIQTLVCTHNEELMKNALLRELARDGQAYVIHNRVETIYGVAEKIREMLPQARIVVGHGQMSAQELDSVFHAFKSGTADILVATSIIENGVDIANANTMLIERADRFGMADLYQMRGRVGRWNRKAFCYFLVPSTRELSEISRKRLSALAQSSGHGGGMQIAMHDLEIRGAGNILGTQQSGHVASIGFHLYCKLLKKTVAALKQNKKPLLQDEMKIEFPFDARLPGDYIQDGTLRMQLYQRLGDCETSEEINALGAEIQDRFGKAPAPVHWLLATSRLRLFALRNQFSLLKLTKVVLEAHQKHARKTVTRKVLIKVPATPDLLEPTIETALRENFPLKDDLCS